MTLPGRSVAVRVPATSANLGPGFDALGLALALYDEVRAIVAERTEVAVTGEGADSVARDESHLVLRAARAREARLDVRQVEHERVGVGRLLRTGLVEHPLLARVCLDQLHLLLRAPGEAQVVQRLRVDREHSRRGGGGSCAGESLFT